MYNLNFMYVMKKLLLILFTILLCFNAFGQDSTYTYEKYGIINQYTNNMVLEVNSILRVSKHENKNYFFICINDLSPFSEDPAGFNLIISLKSYDELNEQYVYIGDAIEVVSKKESLIYKGKCLVKSKNKLDIYLNNQGYNYEETYNNDLSFSVNFYNMKTDKKGYIPQIPNKFIRIYPIRNKTEQEKREKALKEKQKQEYEKREIEEVKLILDEVNIEKKISNIKNDMIKFYLQKTKDIILNTPIEQLIEENKDNKVKKKNAYLNYNFELRIDSNKNVNIFKDKCGYEFPYYNYNRNKPFGDYKEKKLSTFELSLKDKCRNKYYLNNFNCCKIGNDIFIEDCGFSYKFIFETDIIGVKAKGDNFKYYSNENRISQFEEVHDWCSKNITQNGFYFIHYILIDGELVCRTLDLNKTQKKNLKQYLKIGLLYKLNNYINN